MSARSRPAQSQDSFLLKPSAGAPAMRLADLQSDQLPNARSSPGRRVGLAQFGKLDPLAFASYLITFSLGAAIGLAWHSYHDATREKIAPAASSKTISLDLEAVRQSIDKLATSVAAGVAASQEQMTRRIEHSIDRLAAGQEETAHEITELQTFEQYILDRISTLPARPAPAAVSKSVLRPSQAPLALAPAKSP
jgi:hypothetical protein